MRLRKDNLPHLTQLTDDQAEVWIQVFYYGSYRGDFCHVYVHAAPLYVWEFPYCDSQSPSEEPEFTFSFSLSATVLTLPVDAHTKFSVDEQCEFAGTVQIHFGKGGGGGIWLWWLQGKSFGIQRAASRVQRGPPTAEAAGACLQQSRSVAWPSFPVVCSKPKDHPPGVSVSFNKFFFCLN